MTISRKIQAALQHTDRLCDDCLSEVTGVSPRQSINMECRRLHGKKVLARTHDDCSRCKRSKLVNWIKGSDSPMRPSMSAAATPRVPAAMGPGERPWYWEGNVQKRIVEFLAENGCIVHSAADTASRQQGKDIIARTVDGRALWITVKGFPEKSKNVQARHWFAGALHDLTRYRDEDAKAVLAMGLPHGFKTYEGLLKRHVSVRRFLDYAVYWVRGDGTVFVEQAG